jgi:outer membrane protein assembly factor BamB
VTDGTVVLPQTDGVVEAVDLSGERRWSITDPAPYTGVTATNGVAYVGNVAERIDALDAASGERRWQSPTDNAVTTPPVLDGQGGSGGETVYVGAADHYVYAVDADSGTRRWRTETRAAITSGPVSRGDALVAIAGGPFDERAPGQHVPLGVSPSLHVIDADDGSGRERFLTEGYQNEGQLWWVATVGDHVYVAQERQLLRLDGGVLDAS